MPKNVINQNSYNSLIKALQLALRDGLLNVQKVVEYQRVKTYWAIGTMIRQSADRSEGALLISEDLYARISADIKRGLGLDIAPNTIRRTIQFSRMYPVFPENTPLTFTHYLALMRVADDKDRRRLERQCIKKTMSAYELKTTIHEMKSAVLNDMKSEPAKVLPVQRGEPYLYLARPVKDVYGKENMCVDCGFKIFVPVNGGIINGDASFSKSSSRYVRVIKEGSNYDLRLAARKRELMYTYAARVLKVVDGDTLDALIDVGFGILINERFRLKSINAPEIKTQAGLSAKNFLEKYLSGCEIIIVRTTKTGMYGRWLGDLFALPGCADPRRIAADGEYVNQMMLNQGHAVKY